jgi:hypothetical protein
VTLCSKLMMEGLSAQMLSQRVVMFTGVCNLSVLRYKTSMMLPVKDPALDSIQRKRASTACFVNFADAGRARPTAPSAEGCDAQLQRQSSLFWSVAASAGSAAAMRSDAFEMHRTWDASRAVCQSCRLYLLCSHPMLTECCSLSMQILCCL